jgi:endoglucanase
MYAHGAEKGVNEFYHTWFGNGSAAWDRVGTSTFGPAPGFVTGGPNPSYDRDGCCANSSCGGSNAVCNSESLIPPMNQPAQKSYKDFNTSWPLNSWSVTENSNGYQLNYIRMLSRFVVANYDCSGTAGGTATFDACSICSGGSTGIAPQNDASQCVTVTIPEPEPEPDPDPVTGTNEGEAMQVTVSPNPASGMIYIRNMNGRNSDVEIINAVGTKIYQASHHGDFSVSVGAQPAGMYLLRIHFKNGAVMRKVVLK